MHEGWTPGCPLRVLPPPSSLGAVRVRRAPPLARRSYSVSVFLPPPSPPLPASLPSPAAWLSSTFPATTLLLSRKTSLRSSRGTLGGRSVITRWRPSLPTRWWSFSRAG